MRVLHQLKSVICASTGTRLPEDTAREVDELTKSLPAECHYHTKALVTDVRCEGGDIVVVKRPLAPGESLKAITDVYCVEK